MCGTAVVGLGRGGLREAVTHDTGVLVNHDAAMDDDTRVRRLVSAVQEVLARPVGAGIRDRAAVAAAARAEFGLTTCVERHLKVLTDAANAANAGA